MNKEQYKEERKKGANANLEFIDESDIIALDFSEDIDNWSGFQTKDGEWHIGFIKAVEE